MQRRQFLRLGTAYVPSVLGLSSLVGCGGGGGGTSQNNCSTGSFALGLTFASSDTLSKIAPLSGNALTSLKADASSGATSVLPPSFNLTDPSDMAAYGFSNNFVPFPGDQGQLGSCVAWGVGYAMGSFQNALALGGDAQSPSTQVSPADLYAKVLRREVGNNCGNGTLIKDAMDVMVDEGVASLATLPYADTACFIPASGQYFIDGYHTLSVTDTQAIKTALSSFNILPFGMPVYADFQQITGAKAQSVYVHPAGDNSCPLGGHCMAVVGYDDSKGAYRVMNSWKPAEWGDNGLIWFEYETFNRLVSEIYLPYKDFARSRSTLLPSPFSTSGTITARKAFSRPIRNEASLRFDSVYASFLLSDAIALSSYRLRFIPAGQTTSLVLGSRVVNQILRGAVFQFNYADDSFLSGTGVFALDLTGVSRFSESISITLFTPYPDPGGR